MSDVIRRILGNIVVIVATMYIARDLIVVQKLSWKRATLGVIVFFIIGTLVVALFRWLVTNIEIGWS